MKKDKVFKNKLNELINLSLTNFIKNLLKIKDLNINSNKVFCTNKNIKGIDTTIIHASLDYKANNCPKCACINNNSVIKYGTKTSKIFIPHAFEYEAILKLKKQRFFLNIKI